ncbi:hypothetical protein A3742_01810 [Oleiphilus sp. HI0071]|uniref:hypothetical protein n=1 Tax=unclassified Oleiphilus TaxID=2631174 RepID=UPI0007C36069|nr:MULTISPECIES: hypothetical protein [unclassified Oleiphilus]KZY61331.1 hypothetical protein A3737_22105 [Oleiphilus sp. HI0065]KZY81412.1 hypothetical protein A3742_01810 [Oleiphilus sp. HI0071]KZY96769.1 hypothetical protein A3744_32820 [Oleiphilus sp. HI0073]KZZ43739.1 hypothetical protein A3758_03870 [Oleiphilus sp. HI0118]KZZ56595.1 hypothetical protein A3760_08030 [Oleiphilus sp. HI0122]KZZ80946.1 hypothetical protein A3767_09510 [Oleiphilus sp. HI0133]
MEEPNYANYSQSELLYAYDHIDRQKHPERFEQIKLHLSKFDESENSDEEDSTIDDLQGKPGKFQITLYSKAAISIRVVLALLSIPFFYEVYLNITSGVAYSKRPLNTPYSIDASAFDFWLQTSREFAIGFLFLWVAFVVIKTKKDEIETAKTTGAKAYQK